MDVVTSYYYEGFSTDESSTKVSTTPSIVPSSKFSSIASTNSQGTATTETTHTSYFTEECSNCASSPKSLNEITKPAPSGTNQRESTQLTSLSYLETSLELSGTLTSSVESETSGFTSPVDIFSTSLQSEPEATYTITVVSGSTVTIECSTTAPASSTEVGNSEETGTVTEARSTTTNFTSIEGSSASPSPSMEASSFSLPMLSELASSTPLLSSLYEGSSPKVHKGSFKFYMLLVLTFFI